MALSPHLDPQIPPPGSPYVIWNRLSLLLGNILLALLWPAINGTFTVRSVIGGFLFAAIILTAYDRRYSLWLMRIGLFLLHLMWTIIESCLQVAALIVTRRRYPQAIIGYELEADSDFETLVLATAITLTPGTISVDIGRNPDGRRILYVHLLDGRYPERFRHNLKHGFEQRIFQIVRE